MRWHGRGLQSHSAWPVGKSFEAGIANGQRRRRCLSEGGHGPPWRRNIYYFSLLILFVSVNEPNNGNSCVFIMIQVWLFPKPPQEGKIMLTLRHPHLVPIYGCGDFKKGGCSGFFSVWVRISFIFHFGACCFLALMCYIVNVKITTFSQGIRYIEMELLDGDLHTEIRKHRLGHLPPEMSGKFLKHITSGLMHLHSRRLIHRDIKPGNIFVSGSIAKIGDFGLTVEMGPNVTVAGTPNYLPYDIWNSVVPMTIRADLWGLGCVLQLIWR